MGAREPAEHPFAFERDAAADCVPLRGLLACTLIGALAGAIAAAAVGAAYVRANSDVDCRQLAVPFAIYVVLTGASAFGAIRLALIIAPRWPILAGAIGGALIGIAPGKYGAETFGSQPLPFIGAIGFALAALPFVVLGVVSQAMSEDARAARAIGATAAVTLGLAALSAVAFVLALWIGAPTLLDALRELLFLGLDRVGALTGIVSGIVVGGAMGVGVRLARASGADRPGA
jgi:hypothetical protein